jgi:hypothetical protein
MQLPESPLGWVVFVLAATALAIVFIYAAGGLLTYLFALVLVLVAAYLLYALLFRVDYRIRYGEWPSLPGSGGEE